MIGIRVDVNKEIATGHIKRDIAIAKQLRALGKDCLFISADANCLPYLEPYGFQSVILGTVWNQMETELGKIETILERYDIDSLLIDSYMISKSYIEALKELTVITYFDELGYFGYGSHQLINGVLEPPDYSGASGKALLGPKYVSLREEFIGLPDKPITDSLGRLLVTSGGTDNYHFIACFLEFFLDKPEWADVEVSVAVGELNPDVSFLKEKYNNNPRVHLHINATNMHELMLEADYAITAGGTTLYEICATGVCASCFAIADNQLEIAKSFERRGLVAYAGDFRANREETLNAILEQMRLAKDPEYRKEKAQKLQQIVDGKGALRIAQALIAAPEEFK